MKNVDVIIISWAKDNELYKTTQNGIRSLLASEDPNEIQFNPIVVESNKKINWDFYPNTKTIHSNEKFGYHRYLNLGVFAGDSEYVVLCNNDLTYEKGWASSIIEEMEKDSELLSASPFCPQTLSPKVQEKPLYYGYTVRQEISGWCIFQKRDIYNKIEKLDEDFEFWYCDNDYAMELMSRDIKHALVSRSVVNHHDGNLGKTGNTAIDGNTRNYYTNGQSPKFNEKWGKYLKNK